MANPTIRFTAFYLNNKKAATINQTDTKINPNRTAAFGAEGLAAYAKGAVGIEFTVNEITPVGGSSLGDIEKKVLNQEDIECAVLIAGKLHRATCACTAMNFTSVSESGMSNGTATFAAGPPTLEG